MQGKDKETNGNSFRQMNSCHKMNLLAVTEQNLETLGEKFGA